MPIVPAKPLPKTSPKDEDETTEAPSSDNKPKYRTRTRPPEPSRQADVAGTKEEPNTDENKDKVGYCKPPKSRQFKKGQSGNPKGRPKGSKNLKTIVKEAVSERITYREGGKTKKAPALELTIKRLRERAINGDPKAIDKVIALAERFEHAEREKEHNSVNIEASAVQLDIIAQFKKEVLEEAGLTEASLAQAGVADAGEAEEPSDHIEECMTVKETNDE